MDDKYGGGNFGNQMELADDKYGNQASEYKDDFNKIGDDYQQKKPSIPLEEAKAQCLEWKQTYNVAPSVNWGTLPLDLQVDTTLLFSFLTILLTHCSTLKHIVGDVERL